MKKILLYLVIISGSIYMAASNIDLKFATNLGVGLEGGSYYNLYGSNNYNKETGQQAIFVKKTAFIGSLEAKILKSFSIKKDLKMKIGAGASIDITKLPQLNEISDVKTQEQLIKGQREKYVDLPHTGTYSVGKSKPFQKQVKLLEGEWGGAAFKGTEKQMLKLIELSRKSVYASLTAFGTIEIEKILKNFSVYFGLDAGVDIVLEKTEEKVTVDEENKDHSIWYLLERRKNSVRPKVKGYTGINYKGFETEIGFGYPQFVTFGLGYRFSL